MDGERGKEGERGMKGWRAGGRARGKEGEREGERERERGRGKEGEREGEREGRRGRESEGGRERKRTREREEDGVKVHASNSTLCCPAQHSPTDVDNSILLHHQSSQLAPLRSDGLLDVSGGSPFQTPPTCTVSRLVQPREGDV